MLLFETRHTGSFAEMLFHKKRLNKISVQAETKLTPKYFVCILYCVKEYIFVYILPFKSVCIVTNDADTGLGSYYSQKRAGKLYIDMLTNPNCLFNFSKIKLNKELCEAKPGLHAITRSDFTSLFHWLGKTEGLNLLRKNYFFSDVFILLDEEASFNERTIEVIESIICEFYEK